jgi:methionine synthase II (cobalamin-independent)
MLNATRYRILPTTITGSYPRPQWFTEELRLRQRRRRRQLRMHRSTLSDHDHSEGD